MPIAKAMLELRQIAELRPTSSTASSLPAELSSALDPYAWIAAKKYFLSSLSSVVKKLEAAKDFIWYLPQAKILAEYWEAILTVVPSYWTSWPLEPTPPQ